MSTVKSPVEKKRLSLLHDRRNFYGENDKASRRRIPLGKRLGQHALRRAAKRPLYDAGHFVDEDAAIAAEQSTRDAIKAGERNLFRKRPDVPLGKILNAQRTGEWRALRQYWSKA
ncbi:hypothetical protein [Terriglobus albidus]|uniref:hypothetical protein n=1 Tax=Terriglobus albidus TaxID=1592106 RepID=UPI0021E03A70|nr:hypothetical protein [Terriglobus albidus]